MPNCIAPDGLRLAYRDDGEGLPLLCLAGLTRTGADFDHVAPHLPGVRMIRPDYRGRGASDWPQDALTYALPVEMADATALLDHLGLPRVAVLGTSRGGLIAMMMAATAKDRLLGVALNDIGPVIEQVGLDRIMGYLGRDPNYPTHAAMAEAMPALASDFANVPHDRWLAEVRTHFRETPEGLKITYDPRLRDTVAATGAQPAPDLWPLFDAMTGLPVALIRGANSDLLSRDTAREMARRRPDIILAEVPDRGHIPFLDEPEALAALAAWLDGMR